MTIIVQRGWSKNTHFDSRTKVERQSLLENGLANELYNAGELFNKGSTIPKETDKRRILSGEKP